MSSGLAIGHSLAKRFIEVQPRGKDDGATALLLAFLLIDFILFVPVAFLISYTLGFFYPTLAAVEDPLPAYDALSVNEDGTPTKDDNGRLPTAQPGKPVTGSLRVTYRLIRSLGSWRINFHGFGYNMVVHGVWNLTAMFLSLAPFLPRSIAQVLALVAIAPLHTAWTHWVITPPGPRSFFSRIPPVRKVYLATWFPSFLFGAAIQASFILPLLLAGVIGLRVPDMDTPPDRQTRLTVSDVAKGLCLLGVHLGLSALLVTPAHVALTRVQASLLSADEDTLVPFDRSFGGRVEPDVVNGKGFATFGAAIKTVGLQSWVRIYLLDLKVAAVAAVAYSVLGAVIVGQVLLFLLFAKAHD
ncbi:hypothetical protein N658DRAFT_508490 [Parathielavia hyrcaniae]|uniref:Ubiquitin carrier protein n=1 Tax=Parathielavia hyrcaniae TaxID=113614 RepID=A0AAN6PZT8_9PEZI|nr:hypothetical protein N658DRAFT_508490 [Parathielavia hyrcaniae]